MSSNMEIIKSICCYCINRYQISNSAPIISSFIYQLCKELDIDVPAVRGILSVEVKGYKRQFAHCFNIYNCDIIDATIHQYAFINKSIDTLFPIFVAGNVPENIEYLIHNEIKLDSQIKFRKQYLNKILDEINQSGNINLKKFSLLEDSKKENLFYYK